MEREIEQFDGIKLDSRGFYNRDYIVSTKLNTLLNFKHWVCYANYDGEENKDKCIRMSEKIPGITLFNEPLKKYMRKKEIEKTFKIKLTPGDRTNLDFLVGFYNVESFGFAGIFNVAAVIKDKHHQIRVEQPEIWKQVYKLVE
ncbi:hypothetical protein [Bacillus alkalicellulosilyticus]|uniref:hypothetical protein n=1 Tax=Alkalihalobacterium alkalicellulosilyticum TaxID=1912214 RepID=UPI000996BE56|nr:hypothetical protein [Bacillus alkalicellulosilyticus]